VHYLANGHLFQQFAATLLVHGNALEGKEITIRHINLDTTHLNIIKQYSELGFYIFLDESIYHQRLEEDYKTYREGLPSDFRL
jgi:hypothetical protein